MIVMVSCQHFPDDERVYYRELISLKTLGLPLYYFTRSDSKLDMSDDLIIHKNFLAKNYVFSGNANSSARIINQGTIKVKDMGLSLESMEISEISKTP